MYTKLIHTNCVSFASGDQIKCISLNKIMYEKQALFLQLKTKVTNVYNHGKTMYT